MASRMGSDVGEVQDGCRRDGRSIGSLSRYRGGVESKAKQSKYAVTGSRSGTGKRRWAPIPLLLLLLRHLGFGRTGGDR